MVGVGDKSNVHFIFVAFRLKWTTDLIWMAEALSLQVKSGCVLGCCYTLYWNGRVESPPYLETLVGYVLEGICI